VMNGEALSAEQIGELSRLPARDVLHGQLVAMVASPITGLVRGLNALIAGLAIQLKQIADEGMVPRGEVAGGDQADSEQDAQADKAADEAEQAAEGEETESSSEESAPASEETETTETPEGED